MMELNKAPVMLIGVHGCGKSQMVAEIAKRMGRKILDIRLSQYSEGDILGIPYQTDEGTTRFYPPDTFKIAADEPCVLFLDELNRASREVRQAVFQLADSHRLGSLDVHPETIIVSACNPDDYSYQVHTLDPAELDRWFIFPFQPSVQEWLDWADKAGVAKVVTDYIKKNQHDLDPSVANLVGNGPSRRSWKRFSDSLNDFGDLMSEEPSFGMVRFMSHGFLGDDAGERFFLYFKDYEKHGLFEKVLDGTLRKDYDLLEAAIALPMDISDHGLRVSEKFAEDLQAISNFVLFLKRVPEETRKAVWKSAKKNCVRQFVEIAKEAL
jgi:hypothetical protein